MRWFYKNRKKAADVWLYYTKVIHTRRFTNAVWASVGGREFVYSVIEYSFFNKPLSALLRRCFFVCFYCTNKYIKLNVYSVFRSQVFN